MDEAMEAERASTGVAERESVARLGGRAVVDKYGKEHMSTLGKKGSRALVKKYGLRFYSEIAARNKGVKKRRAPETDAA